MKAGKIVMFCCLMIASQLANAGWRDFVDDLKNKVDKETATSVSGALSEERIASGLKQALDQAIEKSIQRLGKPDGFLKDNSVKIPMPKTLKKIDKGLRKINKANIADEFIETMNRAAEDAVPKTLDILAQAVKSLSVKDAATILKGKPDAATQYFKRHSSAHLQTVIKPIVREATNSVGLTKSYKKMMKKAGFLAKYVDKDSLDIDQYITDKAVAGIFVKMADEEKQIRENPVARTKDLLKQVFGG